MELKGEIVKINEISQSEIEEMYILMTEFYNDVEKDVFLKDLKEDWKITLDLGGEDENKEKDMLVGNIGDIMVAVALMPAPIPNNEAVENV